MLEQLTRLGIEAAERELIPDKLLRWTMHRLCQSRLAEYDGDPEVTAEKTQAFLRQMSSGPIAQSTGEANEQHYEVPAEFYRLILGPAFKYSSCYWTSDSTTLAEAELEALMRTCANAELGDGQRILELGCGWGSLTLHMARIYPNARITAISNSASQGDFIRQRARESGLENLEVLTRDINDFQPEGRFDRVVSVEMFEHVRNHPLLLERISGWLNPGGKLLVHVFCCRAAPYTYEDEGANDWMSRNFFTGGVMPGDDLFLRYQEHLLVERQWRWSGVHYQRTLDAWLELLDANRSAVEQALQRAGERDPKRAAQRWRMFLMACSELFGSRRGRDWWVSHYRFKLR